MDLSDNEMDRLAIMMCRARIARVRMSPDEVKRSRCDDLARLLSEGLEIVESLSAGYDVWAAQVRRALGT